MKARVYDNGGKTVDRYTLVVNTAKFEITMFGFNEFPFHPQGFGQYCGEYPTMRSYSHLGRLIPISELPEQARRYVNQCLS
jgi:hypothetical protein